SDITTHEEKTKSFGMLGGIVGVGFVVGPAIGGMTMSSNLGYLMPVLLTLAVSTVTLLVMLKYLPESLQKKDRTDTFEFNWSQELQFLPKLKRYSHNRQIMSLFSIRTVFLFVFSSFSSIFVLYL